MGMWVSKNFNICNKETTFKTFLISNSIHVHINLKLKNIARKQTSQEMSHPLILLLYAVDSPTSRKRFLHHNDRFPDVAITNQDCVAQSSIKFKCQLKLN